MSQLRRGYLYGLTAYVLWGFVPIYFKNLRPAGPIEILAHRVLWSAVFVALLLTAARRWREVTGLARSRRKLGGVALAALLIGGNWTTYIYGVNTDRIVETALGYFITPLVVVLLGVVMLGERLRVAQWVAVAVGAAAVAVLTVGYGRLPYLAVILAGSFGCYGLVKKRLTLHPADSLFVESAALAVPGLVFLGLLTAQGQDTVGHVSVWHTVLTVAGGPITAIPLMFFAGAANRIPMVGIGSLQYVAPVLQLCVGLFLYHEPMPPARLAGFALVWLALGIFTWDGLRQVQARAKAARSAAVPPKATVAGTEADTATGYATA